MVIGDYIAGINWIPSYLKHAPDVGYTIADTVAPAFVFVIGLNYVPSFKARYQEDRFKAYRHFLVKYLILFALGTLITLGAAWTNRPTGWGVLESLGVAGMINLAFVLLPTWIRFVLGLLILSFYQYFLDKYFLQTVLTTGHGGLYGAISWSALLLLATVIAELLKKGRNTYLLTILGLLALTVISVIITPISKNRVSASYILLSLTITTVVYLLIKFLSKDENKHPGVFTWWGKHALGLYLTHLIILGVFALPEADWWYADVPIWLLLIQLSSILLIMTLIARLLYFRKTKK
jgi:predicted acyltransferase